MHVFLLFNNDIMFLWLLFGGCSNKTKIDFCNTQSFYTECGVFRSGFRALYLNVLISKNPKTIRFPSFILFVFFSKQICNML